MSSDLKNSNQPNGDQPNRDQPNDEIEASVNDQNADTDDEENKSIPDDSNMFSSQMSLIWLQENKENGEVIFVNPFVNASQGHRPIRLCFERETAASTQKEWDRITEEIEALEIFEVFEGCKISFVGIPTLLDRKCVHCILKQGSCASCAFCFGKPLQLSNPNSIFILNRKALKFGFSSCHFRMRVFEFCLKTGYHQDFQMPTCPKKSEFYALKLARKRCIQKELYEKLGVRVDFPNPNGGNSNCGNTAKRCFDNPKIFAKVCGLPEDFVVKLKTLCDIASSSRPLDSAKVQQLCTETKDQFFSIFYKAELGTTWYRMNPSLHCMLEHGKDIIDHLPCPPGLCSEEGSESQNKEYKRIRCHLSSKNSRKNVMRDLFNRLCWRSDPEVLRVNEQDYPKNRQKRPLSNIDIK